MSKKIGKSQYLQKMSKFVTDDSLRVGGVEPFARSFGQPDVKKQKRENGFFFFFYCRIREIRYKGESIARNWYNPLHKTKRGSS